MIERKELEAVLFAAAKPMTKEYLVEFFQTTEEDINNCLQELISWQEREQTGIKVRQSAVGIELVTSENCGYIVSRLREKQEKLSVAALETLAVIAFKQPVTKTEIEELRGVNSERIIKQLLDKQLIADLGRKDTIGRPVLYGTTEQFLRSVGTDSVASLKLNLAQTTPDMEEA